MDQDKVNQVSVMFQIDQNGHVEISMDDDAVAADPDSLGRLMYLLHTGRLLDMQAQYMMSMLDAHICRQAMLTFQTLFLSNQPLISPIEYFQDGPIEIVG